MDVADPRWGRPDFFVPGLPIVSAWAPARLDVMGGIADYSGATVLELPLARGVVVAAQITDDGALRACTHGPAADRRAYPQVSVATCVLHDDPPSGAPDHMRAAVDAAGARWAAYVFGPLAILQARGLLPPLGGLRLAVWSDVPPGAGISSSAALEVATLRALQGLLHLEMEPLRLARLAQLAEHRVAGAPCGIMDQATSTLGRADHLLMLRCQESGDLPATVLGQRRLPAGVRVLGIDSGVAHRVGGGQYGRVRAAAFMGRAIIAARAPGQPPRGYLCNLAPELFLDDYAPLLPAALRGAEFLDRYGDTGDDATRVDPDRTYRVRDCATHPVLEQANVAAFLAALDRFERGGDQEDLAEAGAAMYRSHHSYGDRCGLGTPETDLLVSLVREQGPQQGLFGAKITGGGAGGTVAVLGLGEGMSSAVEAVAAEYRHRTGHHATVIAGSGDGAWASPQQRAVIDENGERHEL